MPNLGIAPISKGFTVQTDCFAPAPAASGTDTSLVAAVLAFRRRVSRPALALLLFAAGLVLASAANAQSTPVAKLTGVGYETTVVASNVSAPYAVATDGSGNIYYSDLATNTVYRESPSANGFTQIKVASFGKDSPIAIAVDPTGDVFVLVPTDAPNGGSVNGVVYMESFVQYCGSSGCTPGWTQSVIPTTGLLAPLSIAVNIDNKTLEANFIFIADTGNNRIVQVSENLPATGYTQSTLPFSGLSAPRGIAVDADLNLYIADTGNNRVVEEAYSLDGPSYSQKVVATGLNAPGAVAIAGVAGSVAVADTGNKRVVVEDLTGTTYTQAVIPTPGAVPTPDGVAFDANGQVVVAETNPEQVVEEQFLPTTLNFGPVAAGATSAEASLVFTFTEGGTLGTPLVTTQGAAGQDFYNTKTGSCNKGVAFATGATCTMVVDFAPKVSGATYGSVTLTNSSGYPIATGYLQGVGQAPLAAFLPPLTLTVGLGLSSPSGVAVDRVGTVYIAQSGTNTVSKLPQGSSTPTAIGSGLSKPQDLAVDGAGNVYIFDSGNNRILKETPSVSGYAQSVVFTETTSTSGGKTTTTTPWDITADGAGNVFFVTQIKTGTTITYGIDESTLQTDGTYKTAAIKFKLATTVVNPGSITVDSGDNLYVASASQVNRYGNLGGSEYNATVVDTSAAKYSAEGIAVDGLGDVYYTTLTGANSSRELVMAQPSGNTYSTTTLLTGFGFTSVYKQIAVDPFGDIYLADPTQAKIFVGAFSSPGALNFGNVEQLTMSNPLTATVENLGNEELVLPALGTTLNPNIIGSFVANSSGTNGCPITFPGGESVSIAAGSYCDISIYYEPQSIASTTGSLVFVDNNLNRTNAAQSFALSGKGVIDTPIISWATPAPIVKGTALTATQLDAKATFNGKAVAGSFIYSPAAGTVLAVGTHTLSVTFTPTDKTDYASVTDTVTLVVNQPPQPTITWAIPSSIVYGTPLGATELDATATYSSAAVAGKFVYTPATGTVLSAGTHTLSVTFTPTNAAAYSPATLTINLVVTPVALTIVADSFTRQYGAPNPTFTASYLGLVNGDTPATAFTGALSLTTEATKYFPWGIYDIAIAQGTLASTNYTFSSSSLVPGTLFISQAPLTIAANSFTIGPGTVIPALNYTPTGFVNGETAAVLSGAPQESTTATSSSPVGTYPIAISQGSLSALNYSFIFVPGAITIAPVPAKTPAFSHPAGAYATEQKVTISDATPGATIYYTTDGKTPTTSSAKYTAAITVSSTETVMAIAVAPSHKPSEVAEVKYTIE